jgi:hypothetical protein
MGHQRHNDLPIGFGYLVSDDFFRKSFREHNIPPAWSSRQKADGTYDYSRFGANQEVKICFASQTSRLRREQISTSWQKENPAALNAFAFVYRAGL